MTRNAFINGDLSTVMSPRTVITWAENAEIFGDIGFAFRVTFLNKCDELERAAGRRVLPALLQRGAARVDRERGDELNGAADGRAPTTLRAGQARRRTDRTVQAGGGRLHARHRRQSELEVTFAADRPMLSRQQGAPARAAAQDDRQRRRRHPRRRRFAGAAPRLPRPRSPPRRTRPPARTPAPSSTPSSRRASRRSARCRMAGIADNLAAMLEDRYHRGNYQEITDRADAPLEDAVALMVRERLTGNAPPHSSRKIVELWRDWIEERAGDDLEPPDRRDRRPGPLRRRRARPPHRARNGRRARQRDRRRRARKARPATPRTTPRAPPTPPRAPRSSSRRGDRGLRRGERRRRRRGRPRPRPRRPSTTAEMADARDAGEARRAEAPFSNLPPMIDYRAFTTKFDEMVERRGAVRRRRARPAALLPRQAARPSAGRRRPARQPAAAPADGAAEPRLGLRPRGRHARRRAPVARRHRPDARRSPSRPSATPSSATPW